MGFWGLFKILQTKHLKDCRKNCLERLDENAIFFLTCLLH